VIGPKGGSRTNFSVIRRTIESQSSCIIWKVWQERKKRCFGGKKEMNEFLNLNVSRICSDFMDLLDAVFV